MNLHGHIDKIERRMNERLKEMSVPDLVVFEAALEKARADIMALYSY